MSENQNLAWSSEMLIDFFRDFPFFKLMGMELLEVEAGRSVIRMPFRFDLCQPAGVMHGGAMATLVDTGMAHAILMTPQYAELQSRGGSIVSLDLRIKYLRPVNAGTLTAVSTAPRVGRQIIHTESLITNEEGKEVAKADAIFMMVESKHIKTSAG